MSNPEFHAYDQAADSGREELPPHSSVGESEFGLIDVIEAFTALRHEWRGQSRESRELASQLESAVAQIVSLQENLLEAQPAERSPQEGESAAKLVSAIVEIDWHLTRVAETALQLAGGKQATPRPSARQQVRALAEQQGFLVRWLCRRFIESVLEATDDDDPRVPLRSTAEGLELLVARVRRLMAERQIERLDTPGLPFDAECMNAVEAVESSVQPSGHVLDQLSPAYYWRGSLVRCAEVRLAK